MTDLQRTVKLAQRRLWLNRWLITLGWSLAGAALVMAAFIIFERLLLALPDEVRWLGWIAAGLLAAALLTSVGWLWATRDGLAIAAARLDEAAHLKERLSTGLHFAESADPFARAAVTDALQTSRKVVPKLYLPVRVPISASYAGVSFVVALLFCWLFPVVDLAGKQEVRQEEAQRRAEIQRVQAKLNPLVERIQKLQEKHPELKDQLDPLEPLSPAKIDKPGDARMGAMKQLQTVSQKLESRKDDAQLGKVDELKKMLRRLSAEQPATATVGSLSKALAQGDFKSAAEALQEVRNELMKEPKTPEDKARADAVRADLKKLAEQVGKIAEANQRMKNELQQSGLNPEDVKKILDNINKGDLSKLQKQLAAKGIPAEQLAKLMKMAQQTQVAQTAASKLAKNLAKAAEQQQNKDASQQGQKGQQQSQQGEQGEEGQGQQGRSQQGEAGQQGEDSGESGDGLKAASEQLSELESLQQELSDLNSAMADLQAMQDQLGSQPGSGEGGEGQGQGGNNGGMGGPGVGEGGQAPIKETPFALTPKRAKVHTTTGSIIDQKFVEGEQYKGEVTEDFVEAVLGARQDLTEATRRKTPPKHIKLRQAAYFSHVDQTLPKDKLDTARQKLEVSAEESAGESPPSANTNP